MRILSIAIALAGATLAASPLAAQAPTPTFRQIADLIHRDTAPRDRTGSVAMAVPEMRVDRPVVRSRRPELREAPRSELALVAF